jgi:lipoprotein-releasing system permease protein
VHYELLIAKRIATSKQRSFSRLIVRIAIGAVALSLAVMIISTAVVNGFQDTVRSKVFNFLGHIQIAHYKTKNSYETEPLSKNQPFYPNADTVKNIRHIQPFAKKPAIMKTEDQIEGVLLKGITPQFDWQFLESRLVAGSTFTVTDTQTSNKILISKSIADRLRLDTSDEIGAYFIQDPPRARKFSIAGIYNTGLEEYDKLYCFIDIKHIQKLNEWEADQVGGFEIFLHNIRETDQAAEYLRTTLPSQLSARSLKELNPNLFDWLQMQDLNKYVILILMVLVAAINMITVLLILILERTNMVGILKALGAHNWSIQRIFLYNAIYIVGIGLIAGNILGLGLCALQHYTGLITIPEKSYYISQVPVLLNVSSVLLINIGTILISTLMLVGPSYLVTKITPIKAIRFE